jgi:hypothetical protein
MFYKHHMKQTDMISGQNAQLYYVKEHGMHRVTVIRNLIYYCKRTAANVFVVDSTVPSHFRFLLKELSLTAPPAPSL